MDGLADIAVQYFCTILFADSNNINPDFSSKEFQSFPEFVTALSDDERTALSAAAQRSLDFMLRPPDEHGYTPAATVRDDIKTFLEMLASGEIYEQWCG